MTFTEIRKKYIDDYWKVKASYILEDHKIIYNQNSDLWLKNSLYIRDIYLKESAQFWTELFNSKFTISLMLKSKSTGFDPKLDEGVSQKIRFLKSIFEKGYEYFGFINHAHHYDANYFSKIEDGWYSPVLISQRNKRQSLRKGIKGVKLTKQWVINESPLFKSLSDQDRRFINELRNDDSHDNTEVIDDRVICVYDDQAVDETDRLNSIFPFLVSALHLSMQWHINLLVEHDFCIGPILFLKYPEEFNYSKSEIDFGNITKFLPRNEEKKIKIELPKKKALSNMLNLSFDLFEKAVDRSEKNAGDSFDSEDEKYTWVSKNIVVQFVTISYFSLFGIWNRLEKSKPYILALTSDTKIIFNHNLIPSLVDSNLEATKNILKVAVYQIINCSETLRSKEIYNEIIESKGDKGMSMELIGGLIKDFQELPKSDFPILLAFGLMAAGSVLISGFGELYRNFDSVFELQK